MSANERFIPTVVKWVKLDDQAREMTKAIKDIRQQKKSMEDDILSMMTAQEQDVLNLSTGGSLRRSTSKCKGGLKEEYIRDVLTQYINTDKATVITDAMMKNRPVQERLYLKRCLPKK